MFLLNKTNKNRIRQGQNNRTGAAQPRRGRAPRSARFAAALSAAAILAPVCAPAAAGGSGYSKNLRPKIAGGHSADYSANYSIAHYYPRPEETRSQAAPITPASLGGMARALPGGIYTASATVNTRCFNPRMLGLLKTIQSKYRRPLIITSGYRSHTHNIRAGGVRGSLHTACAAADIKIPGVNKYQLASYVRSLPNRGGVGVYCHNAVHVDIGSPREWNWCATGRRRR